MNNNNQQIRRAGTSWWRKILPVTAKRSEQSYSGPLSKWMEATSGRTAGVSVSQTTMLTNPGVLACVGVLANPVGLLPFNPYRRINGGKEKAVTHPLHRLLQAPNEFETGSVFFQRLMIKALMAGNNYSYIERDQQTFEIKSLLHLNPHRTRPILKNGRLVYETEVDGKQVTLQPYEVLHIPCFPSDGLEGKSLLWLIKQIIGKALAQDEFEARFYSQGTNLGGVFEAPIGASQDAIDLVKESIKKEGSGLSNAHKWLMLIEGIKLNPHQVNLEEAQYIEGKTFNILDVARVLHIPPNLVGEYGRATWANAEHMDGFFIKHSLSPC